MTDCGSLWRELQTELSLQRQCLDMMNGAWLAEYGRSGGVIHCGRGCSNCCTLAVNCTLTEALVLADGLDGRQGQAVACYAEQLRGCMDGVHDLKGYLQLQRRMGQCPLLDGDGACGVYLLRPLTCRSLLSTAESVWCGVDFSTRAPEEKQAYLDSLDRSAVEFPLHYAASPRETGRDLESRALALMRQRFGVSVYGTLPVLIHLVRGHGLATAVAGGAAAVAALLADSGFAHPFLVEVSP